MVINSMLFASQLFVDIWPAQSKVAAFDLTVVSPLNPTFISEAGRTAGSAAVAAELRKHSANDAKCSELGWT